MGLWKKTLLYLGLVEEDELEGEIASYREPSQPTSTIRKLPREELSSVSPVAPAPRARPAPGIGYPEPAPSSVPPIGGTLTTAHLEPPAPLPLGRVHLSEPRAYDDAQEIGDKLRASVPVIMNLQGVEDDLYKRLTAFAAGLAYGLQGNLQRLAPRVYLVTPSGIEVSAEDRKRLMERGFFNEF
jgi:cell division inhibitor SepF